MAKSNEESQGEEKMASYADATKTNPKTIDSSTMSGVKPAFVQEIDVFGSLTDRVTTKTLYLTNIEMYQTLENDLSDTTQQSKIPQSTIDASENTNDADDTTVDTYATQQPNHIDDPSTNSEPESTSIHEDDIDMSHSVPTPEEEKKKKKKSKKERKTTQTQITSFVSEQQELTPGKQKNNRNVERSPVTPTHVLHDNEGDTTAKRPKTLAT
ncbi:unnamed protein product [Mytilus coruscus]|uniref:Uncharacterized protein n=1 Tax=Mytilus coruscus TaxID=42192 RepID=A0A6J8AC82_MYTCO|nr:unnamed protein product [Mytilus coruscus]